MLGALLFVEGMVAPGGTSCGGRYGSHFWADGMGSHLVWGSKGVQCFIWRWHGVGGRRYIVGRYVFFLDRAQLNFDSFFCRFLVQF